MWYYMQGAYGTKTGQFITSLKERVSLPQFKKPSLTSRRSGGFPNRLLNASRRNGLQRAVCASTAFYVFIIA
jgi:hypothetical protein